MNKSILPLGAAAAALLTLGVSSASAQFTTNIQGYWPLDSDFLDGSGNTKDGSFSGTAAQVFSAGKFGNGIDLDGVDQHVIINAGSSALGDFEFTGGSVSISAWFDTGTGFNKGWQGLISNGEGTDWRLARRASTNNLAYAGGTGDIFGTGNVNDGSLHHVVAVSTNGVNTKLYIDGVEVATGGAPSLGDGDSNFMMIGNNPDNPARSWNGLIDDVIIWDKALTPHQVDSLWNSGAGIEGSTIITNTDTDSDGMPDWYETLVGLNPAVSNTGADSNFDTVDDIDNYLAGDNPNDQDADGDGVLASDEVVGATNPWTGTANTGAPGDPTDPNNADSDGDGLDDGDEIAGTTKGVSTNPALADTDGDGVNDLADAQPLTGAHDSDGDGINNDVEVAGTQNPWNSGVASGPPGEPTDPNLADSDGDGIDDDEEIVAGADTFVTDPNNADTDGDGSNDDVEIALGSDPTNAVDTPSSWYNNLIGYWKFDNDLLDSSIVNDAHGNFVTTSGTETYSTGMFGNGIDLSQAAGDYVNIAQASDFEAVGSDLTVSVWTKVAAFTTNWQGLVAKGEGSSWRIARSGGSQQVAYAGGTGDLTAGPTISDNQFHHIVAITEDGVSTRLWIDGSLVGTGGSPSITTNGSTAFHIGGNPQGPGRTWNGIIDDIAIWTRVLSPTEIGLIYNGGVGNSIQDLIDNPDADADGIPDGEEVVPGADGYITDPFNPDTDGDGVNDGAEVLAGSNPTIDDDTDGDTINNLAETTGSANTGYGNAPTDPLDDDSDDDNLTDGAEINTHGTDPNVADTDGDGFNDDVEIAEGSSPTNGADYPAISLGLIGYWPLDNHPEDVAGIHDAHGTYQGSGTETYTAGKFGQSISLAHANAEYLEVTNEGPFDRVGGDISISVWANVSAFTTGWQGLVASGEGTAWRIARSGGGGGQLAYAGGSGDLTAGPAINDGNWHHIVAISEHGVSTRLWIDGTLAGTGAAPNISDGPGFQIGGNPGSPGRSWNGLIDDVAIWDRPITPLEIADLYNTGTGETVRSLAGIPTTIESWRNTFFGDPANSGNGENTNDHNSNGFSNLEDFAFGFDAINPGAPGALAISGATITNIGTPIVNVENVPNGVNYTLRSTRRADYLVAGLTYTVQFSHNMIDWENSTADPSVIATGTGPDGETIEAVEEPFPFFLPGSGRKARWARIVVTIDN